MSSGIPYCDETWNPVVGCPEPVVSPGCQNCWARKLHNQRHKAKQAGKKLPSMYDHPFETFQAFHSRFDKGPHTVKKSKTIFVGSQTDIFHPDINDVARDRIFGNILKHQQHTFLTLTKRIDQAVLYFDRYNRDCQTQGYPNNFKHVPNLHFGLTICNQEEADRMIPELLKLDCAKHVWLSIEPQLEDIQLWMTGRFDFSKIAGVVVGAEAGTGARLCKLKWTERIVEQCEISGVKCFVKQVHLQPRLSIAAMSESKCLKDVDDIMGKHGFRVSTKPNEWPECLQKQELPWALKL